MSKAVSADLARRGRAAWNIEYRRIGRRQGGGWPATFDDVAAAIDKLAELGDPRLDLGDVSGSATPPAASWRSGRRAQGFARGVAARGGSAAPCDLSAAGAAHDLLGGTPEEVPARYALADPMQLVPLRIPILLVHGEDDETVPLIRSLKFAEAAARAGDDVELVEPVPGGHRTHIDPRSKAWQVAADWLTRPKEDG